MSFINYEKKIINCKILYCGPSKSGKTTNISYIHDFLNTGNTGNFSSQQLTSETLLYDFLPINIGKNNGYETHFHLYTLPSHNLFNSSIDFLFRGVDGIIFVADSSLERLDDNIEAFDMLKSELSKANKNLKNTPIVFQWNKRDLPNICDSNLLSKNINSENLPEIETEAISGKGVFDSLKLMMKFILINHKDLVDGEVL